MSKKSPVWKYFHLPENNKAKCKICQVFINYSGGSTSSLLKHLKSVHKNLNPDTETPGTSTGQLSSFGITVGKHCSVTRTAELNKLLCNVVTQNSLPISFVESKSVRDLLKYAEPNYKCISAEHAKELIKLEAGDLKTKIKEQIAKSKAVTLTTDNWTSVNNESFMAVTSSYIDENWCLQSPVLATKNLQERHTAEYLAQELKCVIEHWEISDRVIAIVHDNASNIKGVARMICDKWWDIGCAAHTLQICINHAMGIHAISNNYISRTINAASRLVGHFHHSSMATQALLKKQESMGDPNVPGKLKLIQYGRTRWNSIFDMFERLLQLRWPLTAVLSDRTVTKFSDAKTLDLKAEMWTLMENLLPILKQLKIANTLFCSQNNVSISCVFPIIETLISRYLVVTDNDEQVIKQFKTDLKNMLEERFSPEESGNKVFIVASALDPRHKKLEFLQSEDLRREIYNEIEDKVTNLKVEDQKEVEEPEEAIATASERQPMSSEEEFFFGSKTPGETTQTQTQSFKSELEEYLSLSSADIKTDPLKWWRDHEKQFKYLSRVAKQYLCIPATSVESERHFSAAGRTVTKIRNRLSPEVTETLLFVNRNKVY